MTLSTRWRKLIRDFDAITGRIAMAALSIGIGIFAVALIGTAYNILTREMSRNYLATNPASAIIDFGTVNTSLIETVRKDPRIADVQATSIVTARILLRGEEWVPLLLFVIPDFRDLRINKVTPQAGAWPPPTDTILLEREALKFLGRKLGEQIEVRMPSGRGATLIASGTVHDPSLAPAWQEQTAYGYVTTETFIAMGGNPVPELLKVVVKDAVHDQVKVDATIDALAASLKGEGYVLHQVKVPPAGRHPHQNQMTAVMTLFLVFALLALVLASVLVASIIDGLLAQQVRQIAVMKAIGARRHQIAALYLTGVAAVAGAATAIGVPLGIMGGRAFADIIATLLNFDIETYTLAPAFVVALIAGGMTIPLAFAFVPINRAARLTVREAISDFGVSPDAGRGRLDGLLARIKGLDRTLLLSIRNAFRRRGRLTLTLILLGSAGGLFIASTSVQTAWNGFIAVSSQDRRYDLELQFDRDVNTKQALELVSAVPGVSKVEPWSRTSASTARADGLTVVRTYPDGGHGSIDFRALPDVGSLQHLALLEGNFPQPGDDEAMVLNQGAWNQLERPAIGSWVGLAVAGGTGNYRLSGVVRQIVKLPSAYVSEAAYQRIAGTEGKTNAIRVVADDDDATAVTRLSKAIEASLGARSIRIVKSISEARMDRAVGGHVKLLVVSLLAMSVLMAGVGLLGLASAQGISVAERTREFGIMRTIGGTSAVIVRNILAEGLLIGLMSLVLAIVIAVPLAIGIGRLVGMMSFGLPLPLMLSYHGLLIWLAILVIGSVTASMLPARRAAHLTIRETLAYA